MQKIIAFGEIMLRLSPPGFQRFVQARSFDAVYGGGEANVAVSLANFGLAVDFVTRLPDNELGEACMAYLRQYGVGVSKILWGGERMGIYFLEVGSMQRSSKVIYDRAGSAMATIKPGMIDWKLVFADASWFHWSGITPAIAGGPAEVCQEAILAAKEMDLTVSCDLNFRKNLWKWGRKPSEVMPMLVEGCDIVIGNEEAAEEMLGIRMPRTYWKAKKVEAHRHLPICQSITERFPNLQTIAITLRGSLSASHNTWSGLLWHQGQIMASHQYHLTHIVDRIGGGDAFVAGLIYGINTYQGDFEKTLNFATAASCLKHSIFGDFNLVTVSEVENLLSGDDSGRISR